MKKNILVIPLLLISIAAAAQIEKINKAEINKPTANPILINNQTKPIKNTIPSSPAFNFSNVKACIDLPPSSSPLPPRAASNAYTIYRIDENGNLGKVAYQRQPLAAITNKMWEPGETIKIGFDLTGGSLNLMEKVKWYAKAWEQYANIKFEFLTNITNAVIKIGFKPGGSYSLIGREALTVPANSITMNFGWLATTTDESLARRVILHEFGHALGFIHEHMSPGAGIPWDKEKVYAFYNQPPDNWSRADVDKNIFAKYATSITNYSTYDRLSIMHYVIPAELTTDGSSVPFNTDFSAVDKQYAKLIYPFPQLPPNANGTLKTNDDCDEISFYVEYGVVAADKVEFILSLGETNTKKVNWWKQISIPRTNNTVSNLWVQNYSLIQEENKTIANIQIPISEINTTKGIDFWKAKLLGIHTLLDYKWIVLPAIKGGCRVSLTWNKDSCL